MLALFDKPDPLDGPYFEETIYVTPSRLPQDTQDGDRADVQRACDSGRAHQRPVHAEMRVNDQGVWLLEVAARSIGGLCGGILRHALGMTLEELILRHALDLPLPQPRHDEASGVMMIPIPGRGIFQGVHNLNSALQVPASATSRSPPARVRSLHRRRKVRATWASFSRMEPRPTRLNPVCAKPHQRLVFKFRADIPLNWART